MEKLSAAVVMAAGKSTRTYPLTLDIPKGLLRIANKPILELTFDALAPFVEKFVVVVGFKKEMIMEHFGAEYNGTPIEYVVQDTNKFPGTGGAMMACKDKLSGEFMVIYGDDLYGPESVKAVAEGGICMLAKRVPDPEKFGVLTLDEKGNVIGVVEKPKEFVGDLIAPGCYHFDMDIYATEPPLSPRGEYELTDMYGALGRMKPLKAVEVKDYWRPIGYPWDVLNNNLWALDEANGGENVIGNNAVVAPDAQVFRSVIEDGAEVAAGAVIRDSVVMSGLNVKAGQHIERAIVSPRCVISQAA